MLVTAPALAVFCFVYALYRSPSGLHDGLLLSAALLDVTVVAGPVCAGTGAWIARNERQRGTGVMRDLAVRPRALDRLLELGAAAALMGAAATLVLAASTVWLELGAHPYGVVLWWPLVAALAASLLLLVIGYLVGRAAPVAVTAPLVVVGLYVLLAATSSTYGARWNLLLPVTTADPSAFDGLNSGAFAAQSVWFVALAVLFAGAFALRQAPTAGASRVVAVALVAAAAAFAVLLPVHGRWQADDGPRFTYRCAGAAPRICVHPAYVGELGALQAKFTPLMAHLEGTPGHADTLEHLARDGSTPASGAAAIHFDAADGSRTAAEAAQEYLDDLLDQKSCFSAAGLRAHRWELVVADWLTTAPGGGLDPSADPSTAAWFTALAPSAQHAWFVAHYDAFTSCRLDASDFR
jgi:hypothetical protein